MTPPETTKISRTRSRPGSWIDSAGMIFHTKLVADAFYLTFGKGMNLALGVISTLLFGTVFQKHDIAVISLFEVLVGLVFSIGIGWSAVGVIRFGKRELETEKRLSHTTSMRLHVTFPILASIIGLIFVFRASVLDYLHSSDPVLIWYLIGSLVVTSVHEHLTSVLETQEKHFANSIFYVAQGAGKLLILAAFFSEIFETSVVWYVGTLMWVDVLLLVPRLPACGTSSLFPISRVSGSEMRTFLNYVVPQLYGFAGLYVIDYVDVYFIDRYCSTDDLGAYQFLYMIFQKLAVLAFVANSLLFPRVMSWKIGNRARIPQFTRNIPLLVLTLTLAGAGIGTLLYQPFLDSFFGNKYQIAYSSFTLMLLSLPCFFVSYTFIPVLNSFDRVKYIQTVNIVSAVANVIFDLLLVPRYGIVGAALGTFAAFWLKSILLMIPVQRQFGARWQFILGIHVALAVIAISHFLLAVSQ
jgi:O-antigen/teichoic acid export membrane protein